MLDLHEHVPETIVSVTLLTEEAIIAMNSPVAIDQQPEADEAKAFPEENGLLEG